MADQLHRDVRVRNVEITEETAEPIPLIPLSRTDHQPENPKMDVRGYLMVGSDGEAMGRVTEILLEADRLTEDRGLPLYHMEYALVRYASEAGTQEWVMVPMAMIKTIDSERRVVTMRDPAKLACQEAYTFRAPDNIEEEEDQEVWAVREALSRWDRSGRGPRGLVERRR